MRQRKAAMVFILATLFIDILGIGIIIPILPELIKEMVGGSASVAGRYVGLIGASYAVMQFLFAPVLGALSDRFGRRTVLLVSLFGLGVDYIIQGVAPSILWLFVGRLIAGVMGSSITTINAYIADISGPQDRARNFGLVGAAFGLGFIFGPALGGLLGSVHIRLPFFVAAGLALTNWLYGFFVLPESLPVERRSSFSLRKANPVASLGYLRKYPLVSGISAAFVFLTMSQRGLESVWVLYTGYRFGWDERANGLALALVGVMAVVVQGFLVRPVVAKLGERRTVLFGLSLSVLNFFFYGLSSEGWMLLAVIFFGSIGGVAGPTIQGMVAGAVDPSEQGKVQGALTSLMSITNIFAPILFASLLFSYFSSGDAPIHLPGASFFVGALFNLCALLIVWRLFARLPATPGSTDSASP